MSGEDSGREMRTGSASEALADGIETTVEGWKTIPDALTETDQWVCWRYEEREGSDGDPYQTKVPVNAETGAHAAADDPSTWSEYERACEYDRHHEDIAGIGFMFSLYGDFAGVDFDNAFDPETDDWQPWAEEYIDELDSYTERSPSGTGAHTIVKGEKPGDRCKTGMGTDLDAYDSSEIEIYDCKRFFTVTGDHYSESPSAVRRRDDEFASVYRDAFESDASSDSSSSGGDSSADGVTTVNAERAEEIAGDALGMLESGKSSADDGTNPDLTDEEIIEKAKAAANGDLFEGLWKGSTAGYESHSEAQMALLCILAFWTGRKRTQMKQLFEKSGLHSGGYKDKWERVGDGEISKARSVVSDVYTVGGGDGTDTDALEVELEADLEAAAELDSKSAQKKQEKKLVEEFAAETAVQLEADGGIDMTADLIADTAKYVTKTAAKDKFDAALESDDDEDTHRVPIDVRIDNAEEVKIRRTTDHVPDAEVIFDFGNGDRVPFEMRNEQGRRGFCSAEVFRDEMFDAGMSYPDKPTEDRRDARDWKDYIMDVVEGYGPVDVTEIEERGDRTKAVDALRNEIESSAGFGDLNHVKGGGNRVYWNRGAGEVWILNRVPKNITEDRDVSTAGLQAELDARSCTVERKDGAVSERGTAANGDRLTFWVLNDAKMEPGAFAEDPNDIETSAVEKTDSILSDTTDMGVLNELMPDGGNDVTTGDEADE